MFLMMGIKQGQATEPIAVTKTPQLWVSQNKKALEDLGYIHIWSRKL